VHDALILSQALCTLGWSVDFNGYPHRDPTMRRQTDRVVRSVRLSRLTSILRSAPYDLNIHLESIYEDRVRHAPRNILVPHQEWVREETHRALGGMNLICAKSRIAEGLFRDLQLPTAYIGWSGRDQHNPNVSWSPTVSAVHVAGASGHKGTERLLDVWERHSAWPTLTVLRTPRTLYRDHSAWRLRHAVPNIHIMEERISDEAVRTLLNTCRINVATSEVEGYGHVLAEALSVGAVVITTNAPPMNELVTADRGILVDYAHTEPMRLGTRYFVDPASLEEGVERAIRLSDDEVDRLGRNARQWFLTNQREFPERLQSALAQIGCA
jgi:glycosyltransferase involved in cell wall biosynthesis